MKIAEIYSKLVKEIKESYDSPMFVDGEITDYCITLSDDVMVTYCLIDKMIHVYFKCEELCSMKEDDSNLERVYNVLTHNNIF